MGGPYTTPLGRIVQGDPYKAQQRRDQHGKPRLIPVGKPDAGQPDMQHFVALAIPKNDPEYPAFKAQIDAEDRAAWSTLFDANGNCLRADFAFKVVDGDSAMLDKSGVAPNTREGWAGCWIWKFASKFAPKVMVGKNGAWVESTGGECKCGDHVRVSFSTSSNDSQQTPGMYRNLEQIALYRPDKEIVSNGGPSAAERFGAPPLATGGAGGPVSPPAPGAPAASPPAPAAGPPLSPTAAPSSPPPPPYDGFMNPPARTMTAKAGSTTYEAFRAANWTDEQLISHGYMTA
jgi:hypothetical protein